MASSEKKNKSTLFDDDDDLDRNSTKKKLERIRVNDIPDIDKYVLNLTSEKIYDFIKTFIKVMNGVENVLNMEEKFNVISMDCSPLMYKHIIYELYYNYNNLLKKYFFVFFINFDKSTLNYY
ncbi:unnamed protein product [Rotaria sp. Silwood2]|nr:unnamed protein product [Rotaria sp. Silwood2]